LTVSTHVVLAGTKPLVRRTICVSTAAVIVPVQPAGVNVTPAGLATRRRPSWGGATVRGGRLLGKVTPNWAKLSGLVMLIRSWLVAPAANGEVRNCLAMVRAEPVPTPCTASVALPVLPCPALMELTGEVVFV